MTKRSGSRMRPRVCGLLIGAGLCSPGVLSNLAREPSSDSVAPAWVAPGRAARKANPVPSDTNSIEQGRKLYLASCFPCHGPAGKGDGPAAATLERNGVRIRPGNLSDSKMWQQSDGAIFWKISEGNTPMPSFRETLTEEQRWQVVNYVRTLARRAGQ